MQFHSLKAKVMKIYFYNFVEEANFGSTFPLIILYLFFFNIHFLFSVMPPQKLKRERETKFEQFFYIF